MWFKKPKSAVQPNNASSMFNITPYQAPALIPGGEWFNTDQPVSLEQYIDAKVVLVEFWTFGCINCVRTLPYVQQWYETYKSQGLQVIGVHTPEFDAEKVAENVAKNITFRKLSYPVMQDNNYATWQAYNNRYWPALYLIDKQGMVRRVHFGECEYQETEQAIQQLLSNQE